MRHETQTHLCKASLHYLADPWSTQALRQGARLIRNQYQEKGLEYTPWSVRAKLILPAYLLSLTLSLHPLHWFSPPPSQTHSCFSFSRIAFPQLYPANTPPPQDSLRLKMQLKNVSLGRKLFQGKKIRIDVRETPPKQCGTSRNKAKPLGASRSTLQPGSRSRDSPNSS